MHSTVAETFFYVLYLGIMGERSLGGVYQRKYRRRSIARPLFSISIKLSSYLQNASLKVYELTRSLIVHHGGMSILVARGLSRQK